MSKRRTRSRSRSRSRDKKRRREDKYEKIQSQIDNLTETVKTMVQSIQMLKSNAVSGEKTVTKDSGMNKNIY